MLRTSFAVIILAFTCVAMLPSNGRAATITVTNTADSGSGSLRDALAAAGNNDVINFAVAFPATITLTGGELIISANVTVAGPGAGNLTINANDSSRVFHIGTSNTVTISGLTIFKGLVSGGGVGGGIYVDNATLNLTNCVLRSNRASGGSTASGGGIYLNQSQLNAIGCTFESNFAAGNGAGIYNVGSTATVNNSSFITNSAVNGGGIHNAGGTANVSNSLFYSNAATHGGGIANIGTLGVATLMVNNCTLSSNSVVGSFGTGSQIYNARQFTSASATISNSTLLSNNVAPTFSGGAVYNDTGAGTTLGNTIIQASMQEHTIINNGTGTVTSAGYNLATDTGGGFLTGTGDQISTDPLLDIGTGPRDNGGPTFTIALQANSPAIDKGKMFSATSDQRGEPRPFNDPNKPNAAGGDGSDIGAYEADLRLVNFTRMTNDLQLTFTTIVGKNYQLQSVSSLATANWSSFGSIVPGSGGVLSLPAPGAFAQPAPKFFRALQTP